jgi:hypothetical protein
MAEELSPAEVACRSSLTGDEIFAQNLRTKISALIVSAIYSSPSK